jgi:sodium/bile acid cotransporter 7
MAKRLVRHWFLLALVVVLVIGIGGWRYVEFLLDVPWLRSAVIAAVMFLMALPLQTASFGIAFRKPLAPALGGAISFALVPLLAWGSVTFAQAVTDLSLNTASGILVAATVPSTLASASVWTRRAGGNDAVSMMVTIITNSLCFLVTPAWLAAMLGRVPAFDPVDMVWKLALLVVLPIAVAQSLRRFQPMGTWATQKKRTLSVLAQCGVLGMVFLGAIGMGGRLSESEPSFWLESVTAVALVLSIHVIALAIGLRLARLAGTNTPDAIAVGIAGSQKTLPVGVEICAQLQVTILPIFAYHIGQLLIDTVIADRLRMRQLD